MRKTYLRLATVTGIIGLIIAFENILMQAQSLMILFWTFNVTLFVPLLIIFGLGMISGFFFGMAKASKPQDFGGEVDL